MTDMKKAAPIWSRLSEQLTCCAVCTCEIKHEHDSRYQAGGQGYQPGGRFLPDLSLRGYFSTKSSRANFSGGAKRGAGGGIFVLVSSSSSLAQASDCLCRMISSSCVCVSCIGNSVLLVIVLPCKAVRRSTSHHGADSFYPLDSMPRCCNSLRIIRFIQAERESSPSCCCAFSIFSRKSGSKRNWNGGLPRLSFLCVDTLITPHVMYLCVMTHYTQSAKKAKPSKCRYHWQGF